MAGVGGRAVGRDSAPPKEPHVAAVVEPVLNLASGGATLWVVAGIGQGGRGYQVQPQGAVPRGTKLSVTRKGRTSQFLKYNQRPSVLGCQCVFPGQRCSFPGPRLSRKLGGQDPSQAVGYVASGPVH